MDIYYSCHVLYGILFRAYVRTEYRMSLADVSYVGGVVMPPDYYSYHDRVQVYRQTGQPSTVL